VNKLQDLASERAVLAALCQYGLDCLLEADFIDQDYFSDDINRVLFSCMYPVVTSGGKVELPAILSKADELGFIKLINKKEEISYIRSLFNFPISKENILYYAAKLAKLKIARDIKHTLRACSQKIDDLSGEEDIQDIVSIVEAPLLDLTTKVYNTEENKPVVIGQDIEEYIQHKIDNPNPCVGIATPFSQYNRAIGGGLRRKTISLIGARTKVGKSVFADEVAIHVTGNNIPVLMIDTEMSKEDHYARMLANMSEVELGEIETGSFSGDNYKLEKIKVSSKKIKDRPYYYVSVAGQKFENILAIIRKWIFQHVGFDENGRTNDCLVVYDYFKLMNSANINGNMQEFQALGFLISDLHNLCVKYDFPVLSFVQLNRDGISKESTDVISGSDRLVWLCTNFTLFKTKSEEEQADDISAGNSYAFNRKLVPIVARHGGCLEEGDYINVYMQGQYAKLREGPTRNNLQASNKAKNDGFETDDSATDISDMQ
jgi:replicative DNA helicase